MLIVEWDNRFCNGFYGHLDCADNWLQLSSHNQRTVRRHWQGISGSNLCYPTFSTFLGFLLLLKPVFAEKSCIVVLTLAYQQRESFARFSWQFQQIYPPLEHLTRCPLSPESAILRISDQSETSYFQPFPRHLCSKRLPWNLSQVEMSDDRASFLFLWPGFWWYSIICFLSPGPSRTVNMLFFVIFYNFSAKKLTA